ncbi:MAG: hypothetical protein Ta2G_08680 [Termitinemataceae bacterium]|nr:MAG: hypothetical protein Ta2G_08680 [Termitinemataceae bacterium]
MKRNGEKKAAGNLRGALRLFLGAFFLVILDSCSVKEATYPLELSGRVILSNTSYRNYKIEKVHVYSRNGTKLYGSAIPQEITNSLGLTEWHWSKLIPIDDGVDCTFWVELSNPANKRLYYNQGTEDYVIAGAQYDLPVKEVQIPIFTPSELRKIGTDTALYPMEENYVLICDISLSGEWEPFGTSAETAFSGNFNGNYRTISNLRLAGGVREYIGFFGYIRNANVKNLILVLSNDTIRLSTTTKQSLGSLSGYVENSNIENILVRGGPNGMQIEKIGGANFRIGGIVGTFTSTSTKSTQTGSTNPNFKYQIKACGVEMPIAVYNDNFATSMDSSAYGGIVGLVYREERGTDAVEIQKCYSSDVISAATNSIASGGGIVGLLNDKTTDVGAISRLCLTVSECYNSGDISGEGYSIYCGGIIGSVTAGGLNPVKIRMENTAAINAKITISSTFMDGAGRIIGYNYDVIWDNPSTASPPSSSPDSVYAYSNMIVVPGGYGTEGNDVTYSSLLQESWYIVTMDFDFNDTWIWNYRLKRPVFKWVNN